MPDHICGPVVRTWADPSVRVVLPSSVRPRPCDWALTRSGCGRSRGAGLAHSSAGRCGSHAAAGTAPCVPAAAVAGPRAGRSRSARAPARNLSSRELIPLADQGAPPLRAARRGGRPPRRALALGARSRAEPVVAGAHPPWRIRMAGRRRSPIRLAPTPRRPPARRRRAPPPAGPRRSAGRCRPRPRLARVGRPRTAPGGP